MIVSKIIRNSIHGHKFLIVFIIFSIAASIFCINIMFGYAESLYRSRYSSNYYTSLAFANIGEETRSTDILEHMQKNYSYEVGSVLYITKTTDGSNIIGWDGTDSPSKWWPHIFGTFFSENALANGDVVAYISESVYLELVDKKQLTLGGTDFEVIGYGWIVDRNFCRCISDESPQELFNHYRIEEGLTDSGKYYVIPTVLL